MDRYPEEDELQKITEWDYKDFPGLMKYVEYLWSYPQYWSTFNIGDKVRYEISTGGWSGNEDLISALKSNSMFWAICWQSSRRGGHYEFMVKGE